MTSVKARKTTEREACSHGHVAMRDMDKRQQHESLSAVLQQE